MVKENEQIAIIRKIGERSNEAILLLRVADYQLIYQNNIAASLTGHIEKPETYDTTSLIGLIYEQDRSFVQHQFAQLQTNSFINDIEFRLITLSGGPHYVCCNAFILEETGLMMLFLRNISKAKEHELYLIEFGTKKNTILETMVHHFSGALQLMKHLTSEVEKSIGPTENATTKAYLNLLRENTRYSIDVINDLLAEEHLKAPNIPVKSSRIDVVDKVSYIYNNLKHTYSQRLFSFTTSSPFIYLDTDEFKLLQILNNFVSNAVKFTPDSKLIAITILDTPDSVVMSVIDEGVGIPAELKPFLFERQSIAGRTGLREEKSTGYGLSIARALAHSLKGTIQFESTEGIGSTFTLILPRQ